MKLVGFVVVGLIVSGVVYSLLALWALDILLPGYAGVGCSNLGVCFLVVMPGSLLVGSMVTGFLSCPVLNTKWGLIGIAPGLYIVIIFAVSTTTVTDFQSVSNILSMLLFFLYWYLASLAGVGLGYLLRAWAMD